MRRRQSVLIDPLLLSHRDVKPSNILVDAGGRYVLIHFGLVHQEDEGITRSGELIGTPSYMSPEQVSRRKVDARSDVYSLGLTRYEVLTLRRPFRGASDHEIQYRILFSRQIRGEVLGWLDRHFGPVRGKG